MSGHVEETKVGDTSGGVTFNGLYGGYKPRLKVIKFNLQDSLYENHKRCGCCEYRT
jgi:hypothetical protein